MESRLGTDAIPFALPLQETRTFQAEELSSSENITDLFVALEKDDWNGVFQIIEDDPKGITNYTGKFLRGFTVLHYAVDRGKIHFSFKKHSKEKLFIFKCEDYGSWDYLFES